jgi:hypothetical protein
MDRARTPTLTTVLGGLLALVACEGCASVGAMQTAHTLGKRRAQLGVELSEQALVGRDSLTAYPMFGVSARYGVSDRVDLGGRIGPSGLELQTKVQLSDPPPATVYSLAPHAALYAWDPGGVEIRSFNSGLPLLVGLALWDEHQLVLGPKIHNMLFSVAAGTARARVNTTSLGGTVGIAWAMPTTRTPVRLVTEIGVLAPIVTIADRSDDAGGVAWTGGKWTLQANMGFLLGGS